MRRSVAFDVVAELAEQFLLAFEKFHAQWIARARQVDLDLGFDGVFIAADGDECAYLTDCSERTAKIMMDAQALLVEKGYEPQRVRMAAICSVCAEPFTNYMHEYSSSLTELGPSRKATA